MMDRVRFGEIDALNHVNNAAYLRWFENFRIHYFREYALNTYRGTPPRVVLKAVSLDFKAEVLLNAVYFGTGRTASYRSSSFVMEYAVWVRNTLTTTGGAVIVVLNPDGSKASLPDKLTETFKTRDSAVAG